MRIIIILIICNLLLSGCNTIDRKLELPDKKTLLPIINSVELKTTLDTKIITLKAEDALNSALVLTRGADNFKDQLFVASSKGQVQALDLKANKIWEKFIKESIIAGPWFFKDKLYVVTASAKLFALAANSGEIVWSNSVSSEVLAAMNFMHDKEHNIDIGLVHTIDGGLSAISLIDGKQLWRFSTIVPNIMLRKGSQPIIVDDYVVTGFANGKLVALNKDDASLLWSYNISTPKGKFELQRVFDVSADPVIHNGIVYAVSYQGNLVAIRLNNGELLWEKQVSSYSGLVVDSKKNILYITAKDGKIFAINTNNGATVWSQEELIGRILSKPIVVDHYVITTDMDGNLHIIDKYFGRIKSRILLDKQGVLINPVVDLKQQKLYFLTNSGRLVVVNYVTSSSNSR